MSFIADVTPINLQEEKQKFFDDYSYNPQFVFSKEIEPHALYKYAIPTPALVELAQHVVDTAFDGTTETELLKQAGPVITEEEVTEKVMAFLRIHNLEKKVAVVWSSSFLSRASMIKNQLKLKKGVTYLHDSAVGMIYHELGTHLLRRINYEQQPWFKKKKKFGFSEYLSTEEGLAINHSLLPKHNKLAYSSALRYLAVELAQRGSFSEVWNFLTPYIDNLETRWVACVRQKRGIQDTSQPGGFAKDAVYFAGFVEVIQWLQANQYNLTALYMGKIACQDAEKAMQLNPTYEPLLPSFYVTNPEKYQQLIDQIAQANSIDTL